MMATTEIKRPPLRYYGGKWRLADWIISHFPNHQNYVEPCGGGASVLLRKPRSRLETYNDIDGNVVNFFRVLRDRGNKLVDKIRLTPWARKEYDDCLDIRLGDDIERARRFYVRACMSFNGAVSDNTRTYGWRSSKSHIRRETPAFDMVNHSLNEIAGRLIGVQIECSDYSRIVQGYNDSETLIYFDPPYLQALRTQGKFYLYDWDESEHIKAAELLCQVQSFVIISGYKCPLYTDLYEVNGWRRVDKEANTNSGGLRIESLWLSPRIIEALNKPKQLSIMGAL